MVIYIPPPKNPMEGIDADWLWAQLRSVDPQVTVLDCRTALDFNECHIRQAVHLSLPSIMLRRLAGGKVSIGSVLKCNEARQRLAQAYGKHTFVLCGDTPLGPPLANGAPPGLLAPPPREMMPVLHKSLLQDGCLVVCLQGDSKRFARNPLILIYSLFIGLIYLFLSFFLSF